MSSPGCGGPPHLKTSPFSGSSLQILMIELLRPMA